MWLRRLRLSPVGDPIPRTNGLREDPPRPALSVWTREVRVSDRESRPDQSNTQQELGVPSALSTVGVTAALAGVFDDLDPLDRGRTWSTCHVDVDPSPHSATGPGGESGPDAPVLLSIGALGGGLVLMIAPRGEIMPLPLSALAGSPFDTYVVPGLILFAS